LEEYSLSFTASRSYNTHPPQVWCRYNEETGENSTGLDVWMDPYCGCKKFYTPKGSHIGVFSTLARAPRTKVETLLTS
jgi:hypothetical protein